MTTRGKASKGMVVVDGDGIMFGAMVCADALRYPVTVCGVV